MTPTKATMTRNTAVPRSPTKRFNNGPRVISVLRRPALLREQPAWPALDEEDERDEHENFRQHGARPRLEHLVDHAQRHAPDQGAPEIAHATEHHDHERVNDVLLAKIGTDVRELAQR